MDIKKLLTKIQETGSTWIQVSSFEAIADVVYRKAYGKTYATHKWYASAEKKAADLLISKVFKKKVDYEALLTFIDAFEKEKGMMLDEKQREAVIMALSNNVSIITGGPGTGKTSVLSCIYFCIRKFGGTVDLSAPTGKAAARIMEGTGKIATTLHSLIGSNKDYLNPVYEDYIVVDECSMVDLELFQQLLLATSDRTSILLIGDENQLPSVSPGCVLRDLIDSKIIPVTQLTKTFRQDNNSKLFQNIETIRKGCNEDLAEGEDFKIINAEDQNIVDIAIERYLENVKENGIEQTVLLSPTRKEGVACSEKLNEKIQNILNKDAMGISIQQKRDGRSFLQTFRVGDPVMSLKNIPGAANGEVGTVKEIREDTVEIEFATGALQFRKTDLYNFDLAYAININKAQGCEYKSVIFLAKDDFGNLDRNMIYTGITRAKKKCEVIGDVQVIKKACKTQSAWVRRTFLSEEIEVAARTQALIADIIA